MAVEDILQITYKGVPVTGRFIYRRQSRIMVELVSPYTPLHTSLTMAVISRKHSPEGLLGEEGIVSGRQLLKTLAKTAAFMEQNMGRVVEIYREYCTLIDEVDGRDGFRPGETPIDDRHFIMFRESLRQNFDNGEMSEQTYDEHLHRMRISHSMYHERKWMIREEFFKLAFPFDVDDDVKEQVIDLLRRIEPNE
jgi:hypothetical protein